MSRRNVLALVLLSGLLHAASGSSGIVYEHRLTDEPRSIHLLHVRPGKWRLAAERAGGGRETVASIAARMGAVAAVNGGFFRMGGAFDGMPVGVLKIDSNWHSDPGLPRAAIGWADGGRQVEIDRLQMDWTVELPDRTVQLNALNRARARNEVVLYTPAHGSETPPSAAGVEIVSAHGSVREVRSGGGAAIPPHGFVVSAGPETELFRQAPAVGEEIGVQHRFRSSDSSGRWEAFEFIVGGGPLLIRNGNRIRDYSMEQVQESFVAGRHPRTAVGVKLDGTWILAVVDGRQPGLSVGMTIDELGDLMEELGCQHAMNLDGGGSATFYWRGATVNSPSDLSGERPVSDAILVIGEGVSPVALQGLKR